MRVASGTVVFTLLFGCTPTQARQASVVEEACDAAEGEPQQLDPVIMTLRTRNHEVIVHSGERGLRFTVALGDRMLFEQLDETDFAASFPDLHRHFETAYAEDRGAWAGL